MVIREESREFILTKNKKVKQNLLSLFNDGLPVESSKETSLEQELNTFVPGLEEAFPGKWEFYSMPGKAVGENYYYHLILT